MSARDALLAYLRQAGLSTARAEANLDAFAHELAEQQRKRVRALAANPLRYGSAHWAVQGADDVADLIDPRVASAGQPDSEETQR